MQALRPVQIVSRSATRSVRAPTTQRFNQNVLRSTRRFESSNASTNASPAKSGGSAGAIAGGVAGGVGAAVLGYTWYYLSGTKSVVDSARSTKHYFDNSFKSITDKAPEPSQAVQWLKQTVTGYTKMIPGANQYVEQAFQDIEKVQEKHGDEVNKIVKDTYDELKGITKAGVSVAAATQAWDILQNAMKKIGHLAGDAAEDIMNNHPELKEKVGGQYKQLKQMGEQYGPEAKKQVEDTYKQVQDIIKGGFSSENIQKAQKLVQEKTEELKKYGDKAWEEGLKQAQPVLDKYPDLKETVQKNKDKLLQGDVGQLWNKVQEAAKSGDVDDVKKFVQEQVNKGEKAMGGSGHGIEKLMSMIPGGKELGPKFQQLQELSEKHGHEAEKLIKDAINDIKGVLEKKVEEGKQLKDKAEKDAKS